VSFSVDQLDFQGGPWRGDPRWADLQRRGLCGASQHAQDPAAAVEFGLGEPGGLRAERRLRWQDFHTRNAATSVDLEHRLPTMIDEHQSPRSGEGRHHEF